MLYFFPPTPCFFGRARGGKKTKKKRVGPFIATGPPLLGLAPILPVPLPLSLPSHCHHLLRHLPVYLTAISHLIAITHYAFLSPTIADSRSPIHRLPTLQSAIDLLLFLLLAAAALFLPHPLPPDLLFLLASLSFTLLSATSTHFAAAYLPSNLQAKCDSPSTAVSTTSTTASLTLTLHPRLFLIELTLANTIALQSSLSLYVEAFIPNGSHLLLDIPAGFMTRCDIEGSVPLHSSTSPSCFTPPSSRPLAAPSAPTHHHTIPLINSLMDLLGFLFLI